MKLIPQENGFKLYHNNYLFLNHTKDDPSFRIGISRGKYRMHMGDFKIRDKIKQKKPLSDFKIISEEPERIKLLLMSSNYRLDLEFKEENGNLILYPDCSNEKINRFWIQIEADEDEAIFGCGEQYSELNLRGRELPLFVEEQGVGRGDPPATGDWYTTYYPQPTFISTNNYYCHVETTYYAKFDFTDNTKHELYIWEVPEKILLGKYENLLDTIENLSEYLGRQPKLVDWAYDGIWLGLQGGKDIVNEAIEKCNKHNIQLKGVWCQDWEGINMTCQGKQLFWNWAYDGELYPDLPKYIEELNEQGIKFLGYINPYLNDCAPLYKEAKEKDYLLKTSDGTILCDDSTPENCFGILDLSNPNAFEWIKSVIKENMIKIGLDGYMCDYGEYTPLDIITQSGIDPEAFHNQYPYLWAKANYEALEETDTLDKVTFFMRSGYSHSSKYTPIIWAGDQLVTWSIHDGLRSVIPAGLSLGLCGVGYFHFDIGGFHSLVGQERTKEIFLRWTELATFSVIMRSHEGIKPWDNWQYDSDDETLDFIARMVDIHVAMKPYFIQASEIYQEKGIPIMRACFLHYDDPELYDLKYQFLLGRDLLVAPVIEPNKDKHKVYLPEDSWIHLWSDEQVKSGWITVDAPIGKPPVFYRAQSEYKNLFNKLKDL